MHRRTDPTARAGDVTPPEFTTLPCPWALPAGSGFVTNQPLLAIEVDGFAFHENNPDQRARDALKDEILDAYQMPLLRLPTTGSREQQQIRQELDKAEAHWARLSTR